MVKEYLPDIQPTIAFNDVRIINVRKDNDDMIFTVEVKQNKVNPYNWATMNEFWSEQKKLFMLIQETERELKFSDVRFNEITNQIENED